MRKTGKHKPFNVIVYNVNTRTFEPYDIMPYLINSYRRLKKDKRPSSVLDFKEFVDKECKYQFWSRCEYEFIMSDFPSEGTKVKVDVYEQAMMNLDLVVEILMQNVL